MKKLLLGIFLGGVILVGIGAVKTLGAVRAVTGRILHNQRGGDINASIRWLTLGGRIAGEELSTLLPLVPQLIAEGAHKEYLVLLQNNMELRPTGGFLGSYARGSFTDGFLAEIKVQDIYVPDGQLTGYVEPPVPIGKYLNSNGWQLRDSNWEPDFTLSAPVIEWFFEQGKEPEADGIIAINLYVAQELLKAVGPIYLPDYQETVTAENLFAKAETHSKVNFFPGSTQKQDFLAQVASQLLEAVKAASWKTQVKTVRAMSRSLKSKQILVWMKDEPVKQALRQLNWDGKLIRQPADEDDYLMIVEANVGVNKANCCVTRSIDQQVALTATGLEARLTLTYKNNSPGEVEQRPFWTGAYHAYVRVYVPKVAKIGAVKINNRPVPLTEVDQEARGDWLIAGFLIQVDAGKTEQVAINYSQPKQLTNQMYRLKVQKQSGTGSDPYNLTLDSPTCPTQQLNRNLDEDFVWEMPTDCSK